MFWRKLLCPAGIVALAGPPSPTIDIMQFIVRIVMPPNQFIVMPPNQLSTTCSSNYDCLGLWCAQTRMTGTVGIKGDAKADYYCTVLAGKSLSIDETSNQEMVYVLHCAVGVIHKLRSE